MKLLPLLALLLSTPALADPPPNTDMTSPTARWFQSLKNEDGVSCCGLGDCRAVAAKRVDGHWVWIREDGDLPIPDSIVQQRDDNPTGHSIMCASRVQPSIMYCFLPLSGS